jgi:hypothetical protein
MITGARQLTTACSGRAISRSFIFGGSCAPLMPGVRRLADGRGKSVLNRRRI